MKVLKNVFQVALSNVINFGTSFIIGFILPAVLSVADYGYYREYTLYLSFAYLVNLGFNDGIYIKYGGAERKDLDDTVVREEHNFVIVFQLIIMALMLAGSAILGDLNFVFFSIAAFFVTTTTYHQNFLQATGDFKTYSNGNIMKSVLYVLLLVIGIFVFENDNYVFYVILNILSLAIAYVYYDYKYSRSFGLTTTWNPKGKTQLFRTGIFILIANMSLTFVGNVGNWVVNNGFPIEDFAQYSFQNSLLNVILLVVNAIGLVFYNVISKNDDPKIAAMIKDICLLLGVISGLTFFVFEFAINWLLPQYNPSITILSMTFISIPYILISKILIANLYKTSRSETKYFKDSVLYALFSLVFVYVVFLVTHSMLAIAIATTICYMLWFFYTTYFQFEFLRGNNKELALLLVHSIVLYVTTNVIHNWTGIIVYLIFLMITLYFYRNKLSTMISFLTR